MRNIVVNAVIRSGREHPRTARKPPSIYLSLHRSSSSKITMEIFPSPIYSPGRLCALGTLQSHRRFGICVQSTRTAQASAPGRVRRSFCLFLYGGNGRQQHGRRSMTPTYSVYATRAAQSRLLKVRCCRSIWSRPIRRRSFGLASKHAGIAGAL